MSSFGVTTPAALQPVEKFMKTPKGILLALFAVIGALAGVIAAAGASGMGYVLAVKVLNVSYHFSPLAWLAGMVLGGAGIALAGYLGTRRVLATPPLQVLRQTL